MHILVDAVERAVAPAHRARAPREREACPPTGEERPAPRSTREHGTAPGASSDDDHGAAPRRAGCPRPGRRGALPALRWRPGERLDHVFEERCDWLRGTGGRPARRRRGRRRDRADLRRARRAGQPAGPPPAGAAASARATGSRCCSTRPCTPTSRCWPCSRSTPPTCRWTSASRPTASPTSSRTPRRARGAVAVAPAHAPRATCAALVVAVDDMAGAHRPREPGPG